MFRLDISCFRAFRKLNLEDDSKLILVVGLNGSGKTTLKEAIGYAFTGEAFGYRGRTVSALRTHGETEGLVVRVSSGTFKVSRTLSGGDAIKAVAARMGVDPSILPLAFNMSLCGDGGSKALGLFLSGVGSTTFDPFVHFASDTEIKAYLDKCRQAGKIDTKAIVSYGTQMRALQKTPAEPVRPAGSRPDPDELDMLRTAKQIAEGEVSAALLSRNEAYATGKQVSAILDYLVCCEAYEKARREVTDDPLADQREEWTRIAKVNTQTLAAMASILQGRFPDLSAEIQELRTKVVAVSETARVTLLENPVPASLPAAPVFPTESQSLYDALQEAGITTAQDVRETLKAAESDLREATAAHAAAKSALDEVTEALEAMQRNMGAWGAYDAAIPEWDNNVEKIKAEWLRWDRMVKSVEEAEAAHLTSIGDQFGQIISDLSSAILNGRKVTINREEGIFLGPVPFRELSGSEAWRVELSICAAIARTLKSPLFVIDGADILDVNNKAALTQFLLERITPYFDHCIVTQTAVGRLEDEKPVPAGTGSVSKYILKDFQLTRL